MAQPQNFVRSPLAGTLLLCLLAGVYLVVWKLFAKPDPSITISQHSVKTSPKDTLKYWTKKKKRVVKPAQMPHVNTLDQDQDQERK